MRKLNSIIDRISYFSFKKIKFEDLLEAENIYLYAGDVPRRKEYEKYIGLSLNQWNRRHIKHDVTKKYPLKDNCVNLFQSEDVFEHIDIEEIPAIINEIYRVLKPKGIFRLSLPDYGCDIFHQRTIRDEEGKFQFDPGGGGKFVDGKVVGGGHVWFPTYEIVKGILEKTDFKNINFLHYYNELAEGITKNIDYSIAYVIRTPDHDARVQNPYRPMSIVVDCIKK